MHKDDGPIGTQKHLIPFLHPICKYINSYGAVGVGGSYLSGFLKSNGFMEQTALNENRKRASMLP